PNRQGRRQERRARVPREVMRTLLIVGCFFVIAGVAKISAQDVRVVITPRSHTIPASGKVVLEVRCINETNHSMTIPSRDEYEVLSSVQSRTRQNEGEATSQGLILDHPAPDLRIEPHQVI